MNNFNINNPKFISESMRQKIENAAKKTKELQSVLNQQEVVSAMRLSEFYSYQLNSKTAKTYRTLNSPKYKEILASFKEVASYLRKVPPTFVPSSFVEWINTVDFSPFRKIVESLKVDNNKIQEFKRKYLQLMYDCEWFPYVGIISGRTLVLDINEIIKSSRGNSKRRKARIDKAILAYYTPKEIKKIKKMWRNSDLESHIKKMLGQAIEAHLRGEYVLTITCLATMWEGLIRYKTNVTRAQKSRHTNKDFDKIIMENDYDPIFSDYYKIFIIKHIGKKDDVIEGVPNRNGVAHSWYKKYPNKKASLNAILLTDFIIRLQPKENTEEDENE